MEQQAKVVCSGTEFRVGGKYKNKVSEAALNGSRVHLALISQDREVLGFLAKKMF